MVFKNKEEVYVNKVTAGRSTRELVVCNEFDFTDQAYREVLVYSFINVGSEVGLAWTKWGLVAGVLCLPFFIINIWILLTYPTEISWSLLFLPLLYIGAIGLFFYANWRYKNPPKNATFVSMYRAFQKIEKGEPFGYATAYEGFKLKKIFTEIKEERKLAKWIKEHPEVKELNYQAPFYAKISDQGIFVGRSERPFVTDFQNDIMEVYESQNYLAVSNKNFEDVIFKKDAFDKGRSVGVKDFLVDKQKGKDVYLSDYIKADGEYWTYQ